jgi:hypothetical protein
MLFKQAGTAGGPKEVGKMSEQLSPATPPSTTLMLFKQTGNLLSEIKKT